MVELEIASTWDGVPAGTSERIRLFVAEADGAWCIRIDAPFHGDPAPIGAAGPCDGLWNFEVVELFVVGVSGYTEMEFGPHGHHLVLRLDGVRSVVDSGHAIEFMTTVGRGRWRGDARVPLALLPERPTRWNAFAIHGTGANRRYLCMVALPGPKPDFHQPERFPEIHSLCQ